MLYKRIYGFDCILTVVYVDAECLWGSSSRPRTAQHGFPTHVSLIHSTQHPPLGPGSPYHQIDGSLELHDWGYWASQRSVVLYRPQLWPVRGSTGRRSFTLCSSEMLPSAIGLEFFFFPAPILKREDWEVADWSTDLGLKGCVCYRQRWVWSAVLHQPIVHL